MAVILLSMNERIKILKEMGRKKKGVTFCMQRELSSGITPPASLGVHSLYPIE